MERRKRGTVTDRDDCGLRKSLVKQLIERRFTRFVQRRCRFIEEQKVRVVKKGAGALRADSEVKPVPLSCTSI